ncbi:MAG TPA: MFS transporter [Acidimicrobiales bacterium]|nr:MFS transporter [Acidimicrobiales bacterium]
MTSVGAHEGAARWPMLAVVSLGIVALTLNWFDVAAAFPLIGAEFKVGLGSLGLLISLYIVGYGLMHIPGGVLATKIGMKRTLVLGLLVQGAAGVMSGLSYSYFELAFFRVVSGIGGSVFVAMTAASMVVWFREKGVTFALGVTGGAAFSAGAALALYVWLYVQRSEGWHTSMVLGGVFELLVAAVTVVAFRLPEDGHSLGGMKFDRAALWSALMTRDLWIYGIALLGGYGAYFTTSQLFSEYVTTDRHFDPSAGGLLSALILLAGIPGSVLGGHLADRSTNLRMFVVGPLVAIAALLALIPVVPNILLWPLGIGIGFFLIFGFAAWLAVPSMVSNIRAEQIGSATGLMLTFAAIGGFFVPIIFGHLVPHTSYGAGWVFLAIVSFTFALVGMAGHNPRAVPGHAKADRSDNGTARSDLQSRAAT